MKSVMKLSVLNARKTVVKTVNTPGRNRSPECYPNNQKDEFFQHGKIPKSRSERLTGVNFPRRKHIKVSLEFFNEAKRILDIVNQKYQNGDKYLDEVFGEQINQTQATKYLLDYLKSRGFV